MKMVRVMSSTQPVVNDEVVCVGIDYDLHPVDVPSWPGSMVVVTNHCVCYLVRIKSSNLYKMVVVEPRNEFYQYQ